MTDTREHVDRVPVGPGDAEVSAADVPVTRRRERRRSRTRPTHRSWPWSTS